MCKERRPAGWWALCPWSPPRCHRRCAPRRRASAAWCLAAARWSSLNARWSIPVGSEKVGFDYAAALRHIEDRWTSRCAARGRQERDRLDLHRAVKAKCFLWYKICSAASKQHHYIEIVLLNLAGGSSRQAFRQEENIVCSRKHVGVSSVWIKQRLYSLRR